MKEAKFNWESEITEIDATLETIKEMCRSFGSTTADDIRLSQNGFWGVYFMLDRIQGALDELRDAWPVHDQKAESKLAAV